MGARQSRRDLPATVQDWGSKDVRFFFRRRGVHLRGVDGKQLQNWHAHGILQERTAPQGCSFCTNKTKHVRACEELLRDFVLDEYSPRANAAEHAVLATISESKDQRSMIKEINDDSGRCCKRGDWIQKGCDQSECTLDQALTSLQQQSIELKSVQQRAADKEVAATSAESARKAAVERAEALEVQLQSLQAAMSNVSTSAEVSRQAALDRVRALEVALASFQRETGASDAVLQSSGPEVSALRAELALAKKALVADPAIMSVNEAMAEATCKAGSADISHTNVSIVAPGGGTGMNSSAYALIARMQGFSINFLGHSRAPYDRYPLSWANQGSPAPNLESFAMELASQGCMQQTDCLVVGSRGGQVVLPTLWKVLGEQVPPTVVMNGGCAMGLPVPVQWPSSAVTFLLLGGNDYFRADMSPAAYFADAQRRVPKANRTTAIMFVNEMNHMPQSQLLTTLLPYMILAVRSWKAHGRIPMNELGIILNNARKGGWTGKLSYKTGADAWETSAFP